VTVVLTALAMPLSRAAEGPPVFQSPAVYLDLTASTWMPRGRTLADVAPTIRARLAAEGFRVVRSASDAHDAVLSVQYEERRGRVYRPGSYGTVIDCRIRLTDAAQHARWEIAIRAESGREDTGTPPYLEALEDLQTNPYFFFIGRFVVSAMAGPVDRVGILIDSLRRLAVFEANQTEAQAPSEDTGHGMLFSETVYPELVLYKTIEELSTIDDGRVVAAMTDLLRHPDRRIRLLAIQALQQLHAETASLSLDRLAQRDPDAEVRRAAARARDMVR
jgi:hypothetical protein